MSRPTPWLAPLLVLLAGLVVLGWWLPNRPVAAGPDLPAGKLASVSFAPYRAGQSPLTGVFPSAAEVAADLALLAPRVLAVRTYAANEGAYDIAALAQAQGLKLWQGVWLGTDRAQNEREIDRAIAAANRYPETVVRVVVGNEVLLRRDLPVTELIAAIDRVRRAVRQPVTYADVWEFWEKFPELVEHVDQITVHILPYWEDVPVDIDRAFLHVEGVYARLVSLFPGKPIVIGEAGWPSRGRWRADAVPSRRNQTEFIRRFIVSATQRSIDYNLIEAFDQGWKYRNEGVVGANWGLWTQDRRVKFTPSGPVVENPRWARGAALGCGLGLLLLACGLATRGLVAASQIRLGVLAMTLGAALGWAVLCTAAVTYDLPARIAGAGNLAGQAVLAVLLMRRIATALAGWDVAAPRNGMQATAALRGWLRLAPPPGWRGGLLDDLSFLFLWTAAVLQLLLLVDPRYRDFPFPVFAVPLVVVGARAVLQDFRLGHGGRAELWAGGVLVLAALATAAREGPLNAQAQAWAVCALVLAAPPLLSCVRPRRAVR